MEAADGGWRTLPHTPLRKKRHVLDIENCTATIRCIIARGHLGFVSMRSLLRATQPAPAYFLLLAIIRVGLRVARESFQSYCNVSSRDLTPPVQVLTPPSSHLLTFSSVACLYFGVIHNRHAQQLSHIAIGNMGMKNQSKASPAVA